MDYRNVVMNQDEMKNMLKHSGGKRDVPVLVYDDGKVTIGYGGS